MARCNRIKKSARRSRAPSFARLSAETLFKPAPIWTGRKAHLTGVAPFRHANRVLCRKVWVLEALEQTPRFGVVTSVKTLARAFALFKISCRPGRGRCLESLRLVGGS